MLQQRSSGGIRGPAPPYHLLCLYRFIWTPLLLLPAPLGDTFHIQSFLRGPTEEPLRNTSSRLHYKDLNSLSFVAYLISFCFILSGKPFALISAATPKVYSNFSRSAGLDSGRQKTRHKQKLILATGTAAVSNAFSCAGLGRL